MELNDYQKKAMSTCMDSSRNMSYMAMGLVSEVGELTGKIAKAIRKGDIFIGSEANESDLHYSKSFLEGCYRCYQWEMDLMHELGDILWFAAGIAEVMGWTLDRLPKRISANSPPGRKEELLTEMEITGNGHP